MTMDLKTLADRLVAGCREGREMEGLAELYAPDAVSIEAMCAPGQDSRETRGVEGIRGKHDWWNAAMEVHSAEVEGPFLHGDDRFAVIFDIDATDREGGQRMKMREVGVYTVANGRIVEERFFYTM